MLKQREGDQILPVSGHEDVFEALISLLRERQQTGIRRYGHSLQTFNGRNVLRDWFEERLDEEAYFMQLLLQIQARQCSGDCSPCEACTMRLGNMPE